MSAQRHLAATFVVLLAPLAWACSADQAASTDTPNELGKTPGAPEGGPPTSAPISPSSACDVSGVNTVTVPFDYGAPDGPSALLRYRVFASSRANAPTVLVVPGGPGSDIMKAEASAPFALGAVPTDLFNIIYTDARGSGCNIYPDVPAPEKVFTVEAVARDLLAVVRAEGLTDYILYGASFGSAAVTVAGSLAASANTAAPKRIVLEGAVGRAFASFDDYFSAFETEWTRVKALIAPAWRDELEKEPWSPTLFWSREQWGTFVSAQLILGDVPGEGHILHYWLSRLTAKDPQAQKYVSNFMEGAKLPSVPGQLFKTIACRELWGSWKTGREIRDGALHATGADICAGSQDKKPYDSHAWAVRVPITYFQGPHDPTTTVAQATYHVDGQSGVERQVVTVPDASHAPLTLGLQGRKCARAVWQTLAAAEDLGATLTTCTKTNEPAIELSTRAPE
jgi:pimeloyl-ACP methyl ester carboxylesterase